MCSDFVKTMYKLRAQGKTLKEILETVNKGRSWVWKILPGFRSEDGIKKASSDEEESASSR